MNFIHLVIFVFACLISSIVAQNRNARNATGMDCKTKGTNAKLDDIFSKLYTFGESGRSFPLNQAEATIYCNETQVLLRTAEVYVKSCLKEYPKRLLSIMIKTVKTQSKSLCATKESQRLKQLFVGADCTNAAKLQYQKCINESVDTLIGMKTIEDKQKLPLLCCGNHIMQKCFHDEAIKLDTCSEEKVETSLRFLDSVQGNMLSVLCYRYDDSSDICDKLTFPKKSKKSRKFKSIVLPMIHVLDSIKDEKARGL